MDIKPFRGIRPPQALVERVSSRPYDVLSSEEARDEAAGNSMSLYHIIKPEINFEPLKDEHDEAVYGEAAKQLALFRKEGWLIQDKQEMYYVYAQTMNGRTQYGLVVAAGVEDYMSGRIKKHELTRKDKEDDRMRHVRTLNANMEPVFLAYRHSEALDKIINSIIRTQPEYDFISQDGVGHTLWKIDDKATIDTITRLMAGVEAMYIADGHHRSAAAARVGDEKRQLNKQHRGDEEYNYFLAVCFPDNQLHVMDYNRVVKDLNGLSQEAFLHALEDDFIVTKQSTTPYRPQRLHEMAVYVCGCWYSLVAREGRYDDQDPIGVLDVTISSQLILDKILGIKDLRTDKRIDFVGGIRGLDALQARVDSGEMAMALALYPVTMQQIIAIADSGQIMPPKTTWFEPKLRSGLIVHELA